MFIAKLYHAVLVPTLVFHLNFDFLSSVLAVTTTFTLCFLKFWWVAFLICSKDLVESIVQRRRNCPVTCHWKLLGKAASWSINEQNGQYYICKQQCQAKLHMACTEWVYGSEETNAEKKRMYSCTIRTNLKHEFLYGKTFGRCISFLENVKDGTIYEMSQKFPKDVTSLYQRDILLIILMLTAPILIAKWKSTPVSIHQ